MVEMQGDILKSIHYQINVDYLDNVAHKQILIQEFLIICQVPATHTYMQ